MAKIQRSQLKELIKECIKELAEEGSLNEMFSPVMATGGGSSLPTNQMMLFGNGHGPQQQQPPIDPRVKSVASSVGKTPKERAMFEAILSDTLETAKEQQSSEVDPNYWSPEMQQNFLNGNGSNMGQMQQMYQNPYMGQQNGAIVHVPQVNQMMGYGMGQQQPVQGMGYGGYQPQLQQRQFNGGYGSQWARLAFNSPISNRPKDGSAGGPVSGYLPGMNGSSF